ncbi:MAG: T9SS type A sorting domain-containing protein [Candidatus Delongbacteria bacterium]|nr:T9SS type A sorting domain-containing protein [Candidatus Delongbacteria bacterium]
MKISVVRLMIGICLAGFIPLRANEVLLVLGSDTGIWAGLNTGNWINYYQADLYTDKTMNAYGVMSPAFRQPLVDSYGTPMKMTWWMMAGNMFRYGTNLDVPNVNSMPFYLMQHYHGSSVKQWGDEISLHYHTFFWSDYDGDGRWYWNQAKSFNESREDFDFSLCQVLLDEEVFPVSFRSGWHYMDNDWQHYIDSLLPYSMHNDHPNKRDSDPEPIDNIYDWSRSPSTFEPYHPSYYTYQVKGRMKGWNLRSAHIGALRYRAIMDTLFMNAKAGKRQMACLWGHLPEEDFLTNLRMIDSLAHAKSKKYGNIPFRYCSAVEAMQRWVDSEDSIPPEVTYQVIPVGDSVYLDIQIDEPIFQPNPFVAWKSIRRDYRQLGLESLGEGRWRTALMPASALFKLGIACCDTVGNQTLVFYRPLPEDAYIDNESTAANVIKGTWQITSGRYWECSASTVTLSSADSVGIEFAFRVPESRAYAISWLVPPLTNPVTQSRWSLLVNDDPVFQRVRLQSLESDRWMFVTTLDLESKDQVRLRLMSGGNSQIGKQMGVDVVKVSAMVGRKQAELIEQSFDLDAVCQNDTIVRSMTLLNKGVERLTVDTIYSVRHKVTSCDRFPLSIEPGQEYAFTVQFDTRTLGKWEDTLVVDSDDDGASRITLPCRYQVEPYFTIIDNEDSDRYQEKGKWNYSVATAYKATSRYAAINQNPLASVEFTDRLLESGLYEIRHIVPTTVNAGDKAIYTVLVNRNPVDTFWVDQNQNSGVWNILGRWTFPANTPVTLRISDSGKSKAGVVLRADAVKFAKVDPTGIQDQDDSAVHHDLSLIAYPNPFQQTLRIRMESRRTATAELTVYNMMGQMVLRDRFDLISGSPYDWSWTPEHLPSGLYFVQLRTPEQRLTVKTLFLK